jgi:hypothetical protein
MLATALLSCRGPHSTNPVGPFKAPHSKAVQAEIISQLADAHRSRFPDCTAVEVISSKRVFMATGRSEKSKGKSFDIVGDEWIVRSCGRFFAYIVEINPDFNGGREIKIPSQHDGKPNPMECEPPRN